MVLWVLSLMTIMAGSFALSTQRESAMLRHAHERARAQALAEGAIYYAMLMLNIPDQRQRWQSDGRPYTWSAQQTIVQVRVQDEGGKIDLNAASPTTLMAVFGILGLNDVQSTQLSDAIIDWRDQDELKSPSGAEADDYRASGSKMVPQNRQFLVMEELQSVLGINLALYRKMQSWFTLYSMNDGLDPKKVSPEVLALLLRGDREALNTMLLQRSQGLPITPPPYPGINYSQSMDSTFSITAQVTVDEDQLFGVTAVVRRGATTGNLPFTIIRWRPYHQPSNSLGDL